MAHCYFILKRKQVLIGENTQIKCMIFGKKKKQRKNNSQFITINVQCKHKTRSNYLRTKSISRTQLYLLSY